MKKRVISWISVLLLSTSFSIVPSGSNAADSVASNPEVLYLGYQGPLTGGEASTGISEQNAVQYAIKLFNYLNKDKIEVRLVSIDDQGDPAIAGKIAPGIGKNTAILGIVGPAYSGATIASLPFYKAGELALISPSATRISLTDPATPDFGGPVFHRVSSTDDKQGPALAKWATNGNSAAKVFVFDDQSSYSVPLAGYVTAGLKKIAGASLVGTDSVPYATTDFSPTIAKIKATGADVVIYTGYFSQAAVFIKQLRDSGSKAVFAGSESLFYDPEFVKLAGLAGEGTRITGASGLAGLAGISARLEADFVSQMGASSGVYSVESFDAAVVFLSGINSGVRTRSKMLEYVKSYKGSSLRGLPISFTANGEMVESNFTNYIIVDGKFTAENSNSFVDSILDNTIMGAEGLIREMLATTAILEIQRKADTELAEATKKADEELRLIAIKAAEELRLIANKAAEELIKLKFESDKKSIETKLAASKALLEASLIAEKAMLDLKLSADKAALEKIIAEAKAANEKILADAKAAQEAAVKAAAELKAKEEAAAKAAADKGTAPKKTTITCIKGKLTKKVTAVKPVCPTGYKKKA